jgi:hypothetical protein
MHDEEAQKAVFVMLRHFVGEAARRWLRMRRCVTARTLNTPLLEQTADCLVEGGDFDS